VKTVNPRSVLTSRLKVLEEKLAAAADAPDAPEPIHQLRVSIRRLNAAFRLFAFDPPRKLRRRMRRVMKSCGAVRDLDITIEVLQQTESAQDAVLLDHLREQRVRAQEKLACKLSKWRASDSFSACRERIQEAAFDTPHFDLGRMIEQFFAAGSHAAEPGVSYREIHQFRILSKRFRYTLELFARRGSAELKLLKTLQDRLGELNDCVAAGGQLAAEGASDHGVPKLAEERARLFRALWKHDFGKRTQQRWMRQLDHGTLLTKARGSGTTHQG
jgi:CHAD domain-containing protein